MSKEIVITKGCVVDGVTCDGRDIYEELYALGIQYYDLPALDIPMEEESSDEPCDQCGDTGCISIIKVKDLIEYYQRVVDYLKKLENNDDAHQ